MKTAAFSHLAFAAGLLACSAAEAGRPLNVDDANVDDQGTGHVEAWYARQPGRAHTWNVAPAYAPVDGLELGATLTRPHGSHHQPVLAGQVAHQCVA